MKKIEILIALLLVAIVGILGYQAFSVPNEIRSSRQAVVSTVQMTGRMLSDTEPAPGVPLATEHLKLADAPRLGSADAPVTIVIFTDFECPYCRKFQLNTLPLLDKEYVQTGKVCLYFKHFPLEFHKMAFSASRAAYAAGLQGKFWEMAKVLASANLSKKNLKWDSLAKAAGVPDLSAFEAARQSRDTEVAIWEDLDDGALVPITATPSFLINGELFTGMPYEDLSALLDKKLTLIETRVSPSVAAEMIGKGVFLLDVRTPAEFEAGYIGNAVNMDITGKDFDRVVRSLDRTKELLVYCKAGKRSDTAYAKLLKLGFDQVTTIDGGIEAWKKAGFAVTVP